MRRKLLWLLWLILWVIWFLFIFFIFGWRVWSCVMFSLWLCLLDFWLVLLFVFGLWRFFWSVRISRCGKLIFMKLIFMCIKFGIVCFWVFEEDCVVVWVGFMVGGWYVGCDWDMKDECCIWFNLSFIIWRVLSFI